MLQLIPILLLIPVEAFWFWMLSDMMNNDRLPGTSDPPLTWSPTSKYGWTFAFAFLNVFAAMFYYTTEYRSRR